ncbi:MULTISPECIES: sensor histidine kinase [unclassified Paenibacillus]|uniref:sensor histidine kinase n=1 Tax=unclassified Paenibacillus TaxID=185978 RepID=UPI00363FD76C
MSIIIKTIWWSLIISFFPFCVFSFIPLMLFGYEWISSLTTSWFVLFFPISFAYLIMSKQLYDIDVVIRRIVFTVLLSIVPSAILVVLNALIFKTDATITHNLLSFIFSVVIISSVLYSYEYLTTKLQKIMFPRKYHLQNALKNIATKLRSISSFRELKDIILVDMVNTLEVFGAAIVFKYNDSVETVITGDIQSDEVERMAASGAWDHPSYSCIEINRHEEYSSYLIITRKRTNTLLGQEELQWLNLIISYLAVSLENLHLIGKLNVRLQHLASQMPNEQVAQDFMWFRKLMFELQETERRRIATDLHDTTLQDLFFLKKRFAAILNSYPFQAEELEKMSGIIDYVEIINTNLRQSCFELNPHLLHEIGLIQTVTKVVEQEGALLPFHLEFSAQGAEMIEFWDMETKRHVFRIIQELLNNAKKHSEASKVSIRITKEADSFRLLYEDDGIGFTPKSEVEKQIGASGMGMEQMKSRVLHLNGHLEVAANRGTGMTVWITLPLRRVLTA